MKTATVADLQNHFSRISTWLERGETVRILKRGKNFARLVPETGSKPPGVPKVDFMAQLAEVWGDRVFTDKEVRAMRESEERKWS